MDLLILGATARAAASSAVRAGLHPIAIDLFADRDLRALARASCVPRADYPAGLAALAASFPRSPWIYTGGLENHGALVDRIAADRPLWGNGGVVLEGIRDPIAVAATLGREGLPCPAVRLGAEGLPRDGTWLEKPLASAGGAGIRPLDAEADAEPAPRPCYYQERIAGPSLSAVFVARRDRARLRGVSRQRVGRPGASFAYLGSLAPWPIAPAEEARIARIGETLARSFGLVGLFGVDLILRDGLPWPVEVNPRYTASVEVLELALGRSLLAEHRAAFVPGAAEEAPWPARRPRRFVGKLILYAPAACRFPDLPGWRLKPAEVLDLPRLADVPAPGTRSQAGEPVATLFAAAESPEACLARLETRRSRWERRLLGRGSTTDQSIL